MPSALELRGITKHYPGVVANDNIGFAVERGEIRALVGENGAGKTTLMNILYGLEQPDAGDILLDGNPVSFESPLDAIRAGLGMVHQHFMLFDELTVAENIVYGAEPTRGGFLDRRSIEISIRDLGGRYGLPVDARAVVGTLSVAMRQRIEILKMLYRDARLLILDEPTAVLAPKERDALFRVLRTLAGDGRTVLFITHKLPEVFAVADRATALRDGRVTGTLETQGAAAEDLCRLMIGRDVETSVLHQTASPGETVLEIESLVVDRADGETAVKAVDLTVRAGEIVAIAGAAGNGQSELVEAITGFRKARSGTVRCTGRDLTHETIRSRRAVASHVPEDRDLAGLALEASVEDNTLLGFEDSSVLAPRGILSRTEIRAHAESMLRDFGVKATSAQVAVGTLSGGNRQKIVMAREMSHRRPLLIAQEPTRGMDVGATDEIYRRLLAFRDQRHAILLVSTDLTEVLRLADRVVVMFEGRVVGELDGGRASEESIGQLMLGGIPQEGSS